LAARTGPDAATELRETRALIAAYEKFIAWHAQTMAASPAKLLRAKLEIERKLLEKNPAEAGKVHDQYLNPYLQAASDLSWNVSQNKPDPKFIKDFEDWREAAGQGDATGMRVLYEAYEKNKWVVEPDPTLAQQWLEKSATAGDKWAQTELAELILKEKGNTQSHGAGVEWLRKAAAKNHPPAIFA
jgi:TPR repeat protein